MRSSRQPLAADAAWPGPGTLVRATRVARGLSLAELGMRVGYSASQMSRYERGLTPLTDITVLRRFADALGIPPQQFGLKPVDGSAVRHAGFTEHQTPGAHGNTVGRERQWEDGEDPVRRRQLLAGLGLTAAAAVGAQITGPQDPALAADGAGPRELLIAQVRDAMLGLAAGPPRVSAGGLRAGLAGALDDFRRCRYARLVVTLPRLISAGHQLATDADTPVASELLSQIYTLTTRMLIKLDDQQLGWMAADRARVLAAGTGSPLLIGEAARNLAVLARKAGWHDRAASIALAAAASPWLRGSDPRLAAQRGLLIQSAAYTAARVGDRNGMRDLTGEAAAIAARLAGTATLRDHGGGFTVSTVELHRISAENYAGDPGAAVAAARRITPASLPTTERRARYWTDTARAYDTWGRRDDCLRALLAAEREAPEETHTRPAIRALVSGLLVTGRISPELRDLAQRCGIT